MKAQFVNHWKTRSFTLITVSFVSIRTSYGYKDLLYIGLLNFCLTIQFKPKNDKRIKNH